MTAYGTYSPQLQRDRRCAPLDLMTEFPDSSRAPPDVQLYFLFIEPGAVRMRDYCCTLAITPLLRELFLLISTES